MAVAVINNSQVSLQLPVFRTIAYEHQTWPLWWRMTILLNLSLYITMGNIYTSGLSPVFGFIAHQMNVSVTEASHLATYPVLSIGVAVCPHEPLLT